MIDLQDVNLGTGGSGNSIHMLSSPKMAKPSPCRVIAKLETGQKLAISACFAALDSFVRLGGLLLGD
jgi:hypothetical protein